MFQFLSYLPLMYPEKGILAYMYIFVLQVSENKFRFWQWQGILQFLQYLLSPLLASVDSINNVKSVRLAPFLGE